MVTQGEYREDGSRFGLILDYSKDESEIVLVASGNVWSSFKKTGNQEFCYGNTKAKQVFALIQKGVKGCTAKNAVPAPFVKGTVSRHTFKRAGIDYRVDRYNGNLAGIEVIDIIKNLYISLEYYEGPNIIPEIPYIKMTVEQEFSEAMAEEQVVRTRTLEEISLEKDVTWLKNKKYYIVNDDEKAEQIISIMENYDGIISYDTETTGLKMNMFSKINSPYKKQLEEYNANKPKEEQIRADRLVGVIFCVEQGVSYYFPLFNRKFKNLYDDKDSAVRNRTANNIKTYYTIGDGRNLDHDMARYFRDTPIEEMTPDTIFMERCRKLLTQCKIGAHHGTFEWAVSWCYNIDINLVDDSMILHQLMYKFRSTTSNKGEPSNLKYLTKREFGIDQLELEDFFVGYKEDESGEVRGSKKKKKKKTYIDFSYMDYEGAQAYAPADGDFTLGLIYKYKYDLLTNHPELEYLYHVEILVSCAIGYMEFYGHRLDEEKINRVRDNNRRKMLEIEHNIRVLAGASEELETQCFKELTTVAERITALDDEISALKKDTTTDNSSIIADREQSREELFKAREEVEANCRKAIAESSHELLLSSPSQMASLFYDEDKLGIQCPDEKKSVAKKTLKPLLKMKNEDGSNKYPIIHMYTEWKKLDTLLTKFFDNLQNFMYPGGFIFSSYGQISTATGRMSCSKPNAQQYPKDVTGIVIPREHYVMFDADFSQIEYRTLVALAKEEHLAETFKDPDSDYHTLMASLMYGVPYASVTPKMRGDAKSFNFGIPYGMGFRSLAILLTGMSGEAQVEEAKEKYELYFKDQPKVRQFFQNVKESALVNKYTQTYFGRRRYYSFTDKDGNTSNKRKAMALRQAGNAIIQGSAADIFKISVARNFTYIRNNGLLGLVLIINMIHDEQLMEINCDKINVQRALRDIVSNMEFKVSGFPPLYVGAGIGMNWAAAKGKMAEIHPVLADQLSSEADNMSIWADYPAKADDILDYFNKRVYEFRFNKVRDYLTNPDNFGKDLHPAIGNLINLQFTFGLDKLSEEDKLAGKKPLEGDELTQACVAKFIEVNNLNVDPLAFKAVAQAQDMEEDDGYDDGEEEGEESEEGAIFGTDFALVDDDDTLYGVSLQDLISMFGLIVSSERRVCGIDIKIVPYQKKEEMYDYLEAHACEPEDEGAMQVIFLRENNVIYRTTVWVNGIDGSVMSAKLRLNAIAYR